MIKELFISSVIGLVPLSNAPRIVNDSFPNYDTSVKVFNSTNVNLSDSFNFTQQMSLKGNYNCFFFVSFEVVKDSMGPYDFLPTLSFSNSNTEFEIFLEPFQLFWGNDELSEYTTSCDCSFSTFNDLSTINLKYDSSVASTSYEVYIDNISDAGVNYDSSVSSLTIVAIPTDKGISTIPNANEIYNNGYNAGYQEAVNNINLDTRLEENYKAGYQVGFEQGKLEGMNSNPENNILGNALLSIVDLPLIYLDSLLNFEVFGINLLGLFGFIIAIGLLIFIFKRL